MLYTMVVAEIHPHNTKA